ncbi:MAG: hypothetical protein CGU28_03405 [Candidatus Dactylopiibacterium carminicum]|uniref:Cupin fold metalloprotein, WbuC family n=1 Tax=Candidatus Dactylopiibacterium carminicum TaxID=857335 RepID=A0A272EY97_9RHOO|nr:cupin fold metalloprotein, WbuC family [Candidatus Dactylopiibacterium carminicum]PAS95092.1 MAG: hypothetical protein CGU29_01180 [Candidatus Dactylopiibacterium carminicum]PAS97801.1 MAG: hypothetical protein CGU28_03405 [Candidatus Dactylopiibacterium carminicum]PAT00468.1 MAG: hypothetical protein BSR46_02715 [Candidatus Dactylopiibacterium carminicum]
MLDALSAEARQSSRLRRNRNLHASTDEAVQRLFNAIEPGSYVQPHCHLAADKAETLLMLRGRLGVILFDDAGRITQVHELSAGGCAGVHLQPGLWHSVVALAPGTLFLEVKAGPYVPLTTAERAPWAPMENTADASSYQAMLSALFAAS